TRARDVKAAHLRRDPRASIVVCEDSLPYRGVEVRCHARLLTAGVGDAVKRIASRYLGREAGAAYAARDVDDLLVRLEPGELRAWDYADEMA
ncbi:MAG TPA: pyridoxamine 5'-phosphate oxidase family protein, partial [Streptosporangiaceae bacterium]